MADDISYLPPTERAKRYRELAAYALLEADKSNNRAVRESYLIIAREFDRLAQMAESQISGDGH